MPSTNGGGEDAPTRIAIVKEDKCKPKKCRQECKKSCPVVKVGKHCVEVDGNSNISFISEQLCIGCGICVRQCPFDAIQIINLPKDLDKETTHRYGANGFKLHRLPTPRPGQVLGLIGNNGIGKSTALKILAGKCKPNFGRQDDDTLSWPDVARHFRGSELQNYFIRLQNVGFRVVMKPQYVDLIAKTFEGTVETALQGFDEGADWIDQLNIRALMCRDVQHLSGGELQRLAIAMTVTKNADVYMIDEPSSYLDIRQRLNAAMVIRRLVTEKNHVVVVEHDLAVLDYMSDFICCLYGRQGAYGVVTLPFGTREGINVFLSGFIDTENLRFRDEQLTFKLRFDREDVKKIATYSFPAYSVSQGDFKMAVEPGTFTDSEILVLLAENGMGKTTFLRVLVGSLRPQQLLDMPEFSCSYKPQKISPKFPGTVRQLLHQRIGCNEWFGADVMKPMLMDDIMERDVKSLSGGELQRVALVLCLGKSADIYLLDEPSAYLDSEQRIVTARVIRRFVMHTMKTAFVVEHDFIMATYLADRVIVFDGTPSFESTARSPQSLQSGMNAFLRSMDVTFRRDPSNYRPRINKLESTKDREQKELGTYYYMDD
jgi:ATP-binding cassette, sub-family E, member 1